MTRAPTGRLIGVGVGPGDPELLTLKAVRALASADIVAHFSKRGHPSNARASAAPHLPPHVAELPLHYPVTTEIDRRDRKYIDAIQAFYNDSAQALALHLDAGQCVAVLSEGDPLFYGSYMHLHVRLAHLYPTEVIPGVSAMAGCWAQSGLPIAQGDDVLSVLPGTLSEQELVRRLSDCEAAVIMKAGRNLPKIRRALAAAGRLKRALYVERGTMSNTRSLLLEEHMIEHAPYFSLVLVPGWDAK